MIVLLGPTAVGKSKTAIEIAKEIGGEIISADSMQVYRGMDIGTAKPTKDERQGIPHHLIDIKNPDEEWTVSDFVNAANKLIGEIKERSKTPIICGGTGLYLWTLLEGYSFPIAPANKEIRKQLEKEPLGELYEKLKKIDPAAAEKIHPNDKKRIVRALEVYELTGTPISKLQKLRDTATQRHSDMATNIVGLTLPREELYKRIEQRVDQMIKKGLIDEVKGLLAKGYSKDLPSFQALGYKEVIKYLERHWTLDNMTIELKKRTRHFARRQMTWFKRFENVKWLEQPVDVSCLLGYINKI
ncbi:MAG: tRNA (adenosine(37)-N6)-dimethylallyltransferase MiaA [Candidatus Saganbacteria bacterium]|nr:tRNA (adenosine(37)-N6)-dimethylallyltransferase MiaA [Candidatus Saganbacteria bacterium]